PTVGRWTRKERAEGPIRFVRPELVAEVKYAERTQEGILRAPVFLGLRDDKAATDVRDIEVVAPPAAPSGPARSRVVEQLEGDTRDKLVLEVEGHQLAFSNLNKTFWPAHGEQRAFTKRDLVVYF